MGAVSPQNLTYQNRSVYLTPDEVKRSPIGAAVDWTNLVPGGDFRAQDAALSELIIQASAEADQHCLGAIGTLGATVNTEAGRYRSNRQGQIIVHPAFWPILEVRSFANGPYPSNLIAQTVSSTNCWIEQRQFVMTMANAAFTSQGPVDLTSLGYRTQGYQFVEYTYVNGFFNQFLSTNATAGATSIVVPSTVGLYVGQPFTIYDAPLTETAVVASSWDGISTTIPLASPLQYAHGAGVNVTTLPPTVKEAVIHLVVAKIKSRGQGGFVLNEIGEPTMVTGRTETSYEDHARGIALLEAFKQVSGRS